MALKILHGAFVSFGFLLRGKRTQVAPFTGFGILLSRVQPILSRF